MKKLLIWKDPLPLKLVAHSRHSARSPLTDRPRYNLHRHSFYELDMVLAGTCDWRVGRRRLNLLARQAILIKSGSPHVEEISGESVSELGWVGFEFSGRAPDWSEQVIPLNDDFDEIASSFHAIYREHSSTNPLTTIRVQLALQLILVLVSRCAQLRNARKPRKSLLNARQVRSVESAAHYFRHNFQASLSVAQVAAYHSFCPAYFSTLFRQYYHMPPRAFLRKIKLEKASELLSASDLNLKEISTRCGFGDAAHFSKAFRQKHRLAPGAYRRKANLPQGVFSK